MTIKERLTSELKLDKLGAVFATYMKIRNNIRSKLEITDEDLVQNIFLKNAATFLIVLFIWISYFSFL